MSDQKEFILKLSHGSASRFSMLKWIAGVCAVASIVVMFLVPSDSVSYSFVTGIFALSVLYFFYFQSRRKTMLFFLQGQQESALSQLENYLEEHKERWEKYYWWRVIMLALFGLMMLFTLIFFKDSVWTSWLAGLFPALILAFILRSWGHFNDKILLHDVTRNNNDQTSDP